MCDSGMIWHGGQGGVKLAGSRNARDRTDFFQESEASLGDKKQSQLCLAAILEWECSGTQAQEQTLSSRAWWRVDPQVMPHANNLGFGTVYIRNLFVMHLCRFHAELHIVMGLSLRRCSLTSFIFKQRVCLIHLKGTTKILQQVPLVNLAGAAALGLCSPLPLLPEVTAPVARAEQKDCPPLSHHSIPDADLCSNLSLVAF